MKTVILENGSVNIILQVVVQNHKVHEKENMSGWLSCLFLFLQCNFMPSHL